VGKGKTAGPAARKWFDVVKGATEDPFVFWGRAGGLNRNCRLKKREASREQVQARPLETAHFAEMITEWSHVSVKTSKQRKEPAF